jgi:hypothetical protein
MVAVTYMFPAPDEETGPVSVSRGQPRTHVDRPSPPPSINRVEGEEVFEPPESDTKMLEPPCPEHVPEAPSTMTKRQSYPVCPHCEAQRDSIRDLVVHAKSCPRTPPSARAKTKPLIAGKCVLCDVISGNSLWRHEQSHHFIFPCLAIATERGHRNCPTCIPLQKKGRSKTIINPIEYLMSEPKDNQPPDAEPIDPQSIDPEPTNASRLHAAVDRVVRSLCPEDLALLLRCPKDILATKLHDALARAEALTGPSQPADGGIGI